MYAICPEQHVPSEFLAVFEVDGTGYHVDIDDLTGCVEGDGVIVSIGGQGCGLQGVVEVNPVCQVPFLYMNVNRVSI